MPEAVTNRLITNILLCLGFISSRLSIKQRTALGKFIGCFLRMIGPARKKVTYSNIDAAFADKDRKWKLEVMRGAYRNLGITLVELLALKDLSDADVRNYIKYENSELINELHDRGKGLILLSGHYGNWELVAYSAGMYSGIPVTIVVKPQRNETADKVLNSYRTKGGNKIVSMYKAARTIVNTIRDKGTIALLADQSASKDKDIFVDFFGRPASTFEAPANLALKFDVPIIMGFSERQEDGTYFVKLKEIDHSDLEFNDEGIRKLTERHVAELEEAIRRRPDHWAWQHKRWKHKVPGNA